MNRQYRKFGFTVFGMPLLVLFFFLSGCGGGSGDNGQQDPPVISALTFSPTTASLSSMPIPTATADITFSDAGGNVSTMTKIVHHPDGTDDTRTYTLSIPSGTTSGTEHFTWHNISEPAVGDYVVTIYLTDIAGASSNRWSFTITVAP